MWLVALLATAAATPSWAPSLSLRCDRQRAHVGDAISLTVASVHDGRTELRFPSEPKLDPFTLLSQTHARTQLADGRFKDEWTLRVAAFELGDLEIPSIPIAAVGPDRSTHTLQTEPVPLTIASLIGDEPKPELRPPAPPVPLWVPDWRWLWAFGALLVLGAVIATVLWLRRRRRTPARLEPPEPAHVIALRQLDELSRSELLSRGAVKAFHLRLSEILRSYLDARYQAGTLEQTTDEISDWCQRAGSFRPHADTLLEVLRLCDLAKFAKYCPQESESREALRRARDLVQSSAPEAPSHAEKEAQSHAA